MAKEFYREEALKRITAPEQMNDYLHVTRPSVWVALGAVILLLAGALIWSSQAQIVSYARGTARVKDGIMTIEFTQSELGGLIKTGTEVQVGQVKVNVNSVGRNDEGMVVANAQTSLADGTYPVSVSYRRTQVLSLLFDGNVGR